MMKTGCYHTSTLFVNRLVVVFIAMRLNIDANVRLRTIWTSDPAFTTIYFFIAFTGCFLITGKTNFPETTQFFTQFF